MRGDSDVFESVIENSEITDSVIYEAQVFDSVIAATIVSGKIRIEHSFICCRSIIGHCRIKNSNITGESRVSGYAEVTNATFKNLSVSGTAKIYGWENFDGLSGRIMSGIWERPPRVAHYDDLGLTITEAENKAAAVGCIVKPLDAWLKIGDRYGRADGWTPEQVLRLRRLFESWLDTPI